MSFQETRDQIIRTKEKSNMIYRRTPGYKWWIFRTQYIQPLRMH